MEGLPPQIETWPPDVDMFFALFPTTFLPQHPLIVYKCYQSPLFDVYPGVPKTLQLCPRPSIRVKLPNNADVNTFKKHIERKFYEAGCEQTVEKEDNSQVMFERVLAVPDAQ